MDQITDLPFDLPSVSRKKVTAAFDGGRISSDGGVMLLSAAERQIGIIDRLWRLIPDRRNPLLVTQNWPSNASEHNCCCERIRTILVPRCRIAVG